MIVPHIMIELRQHLDLDEILFRIILMFIILLMNMF